MITKKIFLPGNSLKDAFKVRIEVFVEEQGFSPELEVDSFDPLAYHTVFYESNEPVATGRVFPDTDKPGVYYIGRIAVLKRLRGAGLGRVLMDTLEKIAVENTANVIRLGAQCRAEGFYNACGYTTYGDIYDEEGCPHIHMEKVL